MNLKKNLEKELEKRQLTSKQSASQLEIQWQKEQSRRNEFNILFIKKYLKKNDVINQLEKRIQWIMDIADIELISHHDVVENNIYLSKSKNAQNFLFHVNEKKSYFWEQNLLTLGATVTCSKEQTFWCIKGDDGNLKASGLNKNKMLNLFERQLIGLAANKEWAKRLIEWGHSPIFDAHEFQYGRQFSGRDKPCEFLIGYRDLEKKYNRLKEIEEESQLEKNKI